MNTGHSHTRCRQRNAAAFTMVEIAIAIAVIGFALVAILGVLPTGLQVQRDNREDTIINQDGLYWMEAIRTGATGSVELARYVRWIDNANATYTNTVDILSVLSSPVPANGYHRAKVRAISGPAVERDQQKIGFEYIMLTSVQPTSSNSNLYDIQLIFRWPWIQTAAAEGTNGTGRKVFRTVASGRLVNTNGLYVFQPGVFEP